MVASVAALAADEKLRRAVESLLAQKPPLRAVHVWDQGGGAGPLLASLPGVTVHTPGANLGYAAAHNRTLARARAEGVPYVFLAGPDVELPGDHVWRLTLALEADPGAAAAGGRLLWPGGGELDTTGILATRGRAFRDRGQGEPADGRYETPGEVFALSGTALLLRLRALEEVAVGGEVLDESFFAYKEDVDLAWRLRLRGWRLLYVPAATGIHHRLSRRPQGPPFVARRRIPRLVRVLSFRNQLLTLTKNEHPRTLLTPDCLFLLARHTALALYLALAEPGVFWPGLLGFLRRLPGALRRRRALKRRVPYRALRAWFRPPSALPSPRPLVMLPEEASETRP